MNPVEIEEAVSQLAEEPFDREEFPFQFLSAFGNKKTTVDRLRKGATNQSDVENGVLQRSNLHIATCAAAGVAEALTALRESPKTASQKAKFILATDGVEFQAEDVQSGETVVCDYPDFADHFGFFLPLAGITTTPELAENPFDIKATGRLNKLYVQLRRDNPEWEDRREDMNHFMARLIFCFFAEDTDIFHAGYKFTETVERMTSGAHDITHEVIGELFLAMNTKHAERDALGIKTWAGGFPYVNGELFIGSLDVPVFSKIARSYLIHIGNLDWTKINPDIFGSMIQAVADDEERGALGMHYTSVPNILKVLNPLFLDDLRAKQKEAGDNARKLLNLRNRMAKIRVFDPACGSGNFLVIAYKEMRAIEAKINQLRGEPDRKTEIPLTNFRGIELRHFPAEIARLALIIAEYQCDVLYRGQQEALAEFLPLDSENWITCGNALRLDWLSICPPTGTGVKLRGDDLFQSPLDQSEIDFENAGGETYVCGNPPYIGYYRQNADQKGDLEHIFSDESDKWKSLDYISGWFRKLAEIIPNGFVGGFVTTSSVCQGEQAAILWPLIFQKGIEISYAVPSFKWSNNASHNAIVHVAIVGLAPRGTEVKTIYDGEVKREVDYINQYLTASKPIDLQALSKCPPDRSPMILGNMAKDGGHLIMADDEAREAVALDGRVSNFLEDFVGSQEFVKGFRRKCLWISDEDRDAAEAIPFLMNRLDGVRRMREESTAKSTRDAADTPHRFKQIQGGPEGHCVIVPRHTSENREYLPVGLLGEGVVLADSALGIFKPELWNLSVIGSKIHRCWIGAVCGRIKTDFRYSSVLGWNTFPLPKLTMQNMADLTHCAENILLAREAHFPATIADLYDPGAMPENLRRAHEENDEVLERIYIGRRFRNDTERLEKLFELYTKMTGKKAAA
ncbi:MAG: DNA methyltransferase [Erythrobacter sp.]|uniref:class I SAM-dependent DNA methyltransferase n=1 Tax=Erythrobacter sp. TaxID=1042 RepID=UPI003C781BB7